MNQDKQLTDIRPSVAFGRYSIAFFILLQGCSENKDNSVTLAAMKMEKSEVSMTGKDGTLHHPGRQSFAASIRIDSLKDNVYQLTYRLSDIQLDSIVNVQLPLTFTPTDGASVDEIKHAPHWVPNLKKSPNSIMAQHVFRSPAIILTHGNEATAVIPDITYINSRAPAPYYMNLDFEPEGAVVSYGLSHYKTTGHVYYQRSDSVIHLPQDLSFGTFLISSTPEHIWRRTNAFLWKQFAAPYLDSLSPQVLPFSGYAQRGYDMAEQKFWVPGPTDATGGITLSTFFDESAGVYHGREFKNDIWFHSWFNSARTAYGMYQWGQLKQNKDWKARAMATMRLLLQSPRRQGLFSTIWVPDGNHWVTSGQGGGPDLYHLPDNAWTAIWLLRFNEELMHVPAADEFLLDFALGLLRLQQPDGSFPARVKAQTLQPDPVLGHTASGAMPTWFLEEMLLRNKLRGADAERTKAAVQKSLTFLADKVLPTVRFEDYEVFFSCAPNHPGDFDSLTWLYPHNTLSIQWSAEAFLKGYQLFNDPKLLERGEFCLDILSLYQQVWSPPFIDFYAFGGFGVQNTDAEWSDARQAQFAETYLNYYFATGTKEYLERCIAATRASFALMAIPENKDICPQNYKGTTYNGEYPGAMAENFGHSGYNHRSGQSGFHWGTGSALTTAAILKERLGDLFVDQNGKFVVGVDGYVVRSTAWGDTLKITTHHLPGIPQPIIKSKDAELAGTTVVIDGSLTTIH